MERLREILSVSERRKPAYTHSHTRTPACNPKHICFLHLNRERSPPTSSFQTQLGGPSSPQPHTSSPPSIFPSQAYARTTVLCAHTHAHAHTHMQLCQHTSGQIRSHSSAVPALFSGEEKNNNLMHLHLLLASLALCSTHKPHFYLANKHSRMHACKKTHTSILPHPLPSLYPAL